jgi:hypothetical protein
MTVECRGVHDPAQTTTDLFWKMIWQQNVDTIAMITTLVEGSMFLSFVLCVFLKCLIIVILLMIIVRSLLSLSL